MRLELLQEIFFMVVKDSDRRFCMLPLLSRRGQYLQFTRLQKLKPLFLFLGRSLCALARLRSKSELEGLAVGDEVCGMPVLKKSVIDFCTVIFGADGALGKSLVGVSGL